MFTYDGNENGNYTVFKNKKKYAELFVGEDEAIELIDSLNNLYESKLSDFDIWLYPEDLNQDLVINICADEGEIMTNTYSLPENWRDLVTNDKGKDGKQSIHDIMVLIS